MSGSKNNLSSPQEWLARARSNFKLAQAEKVEEIYWEDLCFELQQCVEKSIKAVLIFKGVEFPYVHDKLLCKGKTDFVGAGVGRSSGVE